MIERFDGFPEVFEDKLVSPEEISSLNEQEWGEIEAEARDFSNLRRKELQIKPIKGSFDLAHLCAIHKYMFQDVSSVAGMVRNVGMQGHGAVFAHPEQIEDIFNVQINAMKEQMLACKTYGQFAVVSANMLNHINFAHPFREGNGRATRVFMEQLADVFNVSYRLDNLSAHEQSDWYAACANGFKGNLKPLIEFFQNQIMSKEASETLVMFSAKLQQQNLPEKQFKYIYNEVKDRLNKLPDEDVKNFKSKLVESQSSLEKNKQDDLER